MHLTKLPTPRGKLRSLPGTITFIHPGDVLIVHSKNRLSQATMTSLQQGIKNIFPTHTVVILNSGITLTTARPTMDQSSSETQQHLRDAGLLTPEYHEIKPRDIPGSRPNS